MEKKKSNLASLYGSSVSGILEIALFHPFDTATKRLISNEQKIKNLDQLKKVVLRDNASKGWVRGITTLYPGFGFATNLQNVPKNL